MAYLIETLNPFEPFNSIKTEIPAGVTIRDLVKQKNPNGEFSTPTICIINGKHVMRKEWDTRLIEQDDVVNFIACAGYTLVAVIILVIIVIAFTVYTILSRPKVPGEQPGSDPVFSVKGQSNAIRLGEPIEVCYGRNRVYPSYASRPYYEYQDNEQFQFSLFCLGQGETEISAIQIGDTPIANFQEVEYEVIQPGGAITLFPAAVYTASEAGGQVMFAPNQLEYVAPGWLGPFPANPSGTLARKISVDFVLGKGLYRMTKSGKPDIAGVNFEVAYRAIDDAGTPLGFYIDFTGDPFIQITGATTTPQRKTYSIDVPLGRYEVRVRRISAAGLAANFGDEITWEGLRSYLDEEQDFGDRTLLAVKIRATNNLNDRTQAQFNVVCTRKIPIRESGGFSAPQISRSIVWAFVDAFRSLYGGRVAEVYFDWDMLDELDSFYADRGEFFDWIFRDPITVWEAAKTIARVGRATPLLAGSLITLKRDGPLEIPVAMFNQENIVSGSFEYNVELWDVDEYDSVRIEYTDATTGYKQETVLCILPGGTGDHPEDIRLPGCQDRNNAYHEGLYIQAVRRYVRANATFDTGLEGYIPTFGDLIAVVHDVPKWGQGGYIVHAERGEGIKYTLWLSEPLDWTHGSSHQIYLSGRRGEVIGPLTAIRTLDLKQCVIESVSDIDFLLGGRNEPMRFAFGLANDITEYLRVVKVEPQGNEVIRITAATNAPIVHTFDGLTAPTLTSPNVPPAAPALPEILELKLTQIDAALHIVQASWTATFGAQYYIVQTSEDGEHWRDRGRVYKTSMQFQVFPGDLWVRVAAVNEGQGPWIEETLSIGFILALNLTGAWVDLEWTIEWQEVIQATAFIVNVYDNRESGPVLIRTETVLSRDYTYDYDKAVEDGVFTREMLVEVIPVFQDEEDDSTPVQLELENPIPLPPTGMAHNTFDIESDGDITYRFTWNPPTEEDVHRVKLWVSETLNFDPEVEVAVIDDISSAPGIAGTPTEMFYAPPLDSFHSHPILYWRVGFFDVFGEEISTNISAQQVIAAYP